MYFKLFNKEIYDALKILVNLVIVQLQSHSYDEIVVVDLLAGRRQQLIALRMELGHSILDPLRF